MDIFHKIDDNVWEIYEVKDSPEVKSQFFKDATYQAWVLAKCGIKLDAVYIVYHYDNKKDPFKPVDVTEEAIEYAKVVSENVQRLKAVKEEKFEIDVPMESKFSSPYVCWYCNYCEEKENNN